MKETNLIPRKWGNSLHYDFRYRIPPDLVDYFEGRRQFQISLLFRIEWKCGVTYEDINDPPVMMSYRSFGCFPVDNLKYKVDVQISCEDSKPENFLLFFFGVNQLKVECKLK